MSNGRNGDFSHNLQFCFIGYPFWLFSDVLWLFLENHQNTWLRDDAGAGAVFTSTAFVHHNFRFFKTVWRVSFALI
jgi:hypothetical protein